MLFRKVAEFIDVFEEHLFCSLRGEENRRESLDALEYESNIFITSFLPLSTARQLDAEKIK